MDIRDIKILEMRGGAIALRDDSSREEQFQNATLRPILKLQNSLFVEAFINYVNKSKADFNSFTVEKKLHFIENAIQKDIKFRNALKGMVLAMFTVEEFRDYIQNSSSLNKRMMNMLTERLKDQVQLIIMHE